MQNKAKSIRPFIGAKYFEDSRRFCRDFGYLETILVPNFSIFKTGNFSFYLRDSYVKKCGTLLDNNSNYKLINKK